MTDNNSSNTIRSKLTLKLSSSVGVTAQTPSLPAKPAIEKKVGSSSIQVTIKGRKKDNKGNDSTSLSHNEMADRIKAVSKSGKALSDDIKTHEILSKITKESRKEEEEAAEAEAEIAVKAEPSPAPEEAPIRTTTNYKLDVFDVRNKIKQASDISNREKEVREKLVEEKKKAEQARLEKEKIENEKKKHKKPFGAVTKNFEDDSLNKKKPGFKEERTNTKKLTYIIDANANDDSGSGRRRKKSKGKYQVVDPNHKEYKKVSREVLLPELLTVSDLAERMSEKTGDVVKKLFSMGMVVTSNQGIDADTAEIIIGEFGHTAKRVSHSDVENVLVSDTGEHEAISRAPIVTIMGHVDHGKTSLLDALRQTDVVSGEHGGITQHIGASRIQTKSGKYITFLDTPGHEAFSEMRSRGANVTDIVVLVVAADDGVKAQTIEAINHAKAAGVPIIVAVNKIDKPGADPLRVKNELLSHEIVAEDLGGDVMFVHVSAKAKTNLDKLEEAILLQAEVLDLKAPCSGKSSGTVLESRIDPSRGVVATLLIQSGTLDISDIIVVGTSFGRVRKMSDDNGNNVKSATPSIPVEVLGLDNAPNAGDKFVEVDEERQAREIISYRERKEREDKALKNSVKSFDDILRKSGSGTLKYLNILLKGDVHGSVEAIVGSVAKLNNDEVAIKVVHSATGAISESDISLAAASGAIIIGFNVRANPLAKEMAKVKGVDIRYYSIIYNLIDDLKLLLSGMLTPIQNEEFLGRAEIRQVFKVSGSGKVAGSFVTDGTIKRQARARLLRDNVVIHEGTLRTLKRFKDDVKEVKSGFECGIAFENYEDIKEKDLVECYEVVEQKRSL